MDEKEILKITKEIMMHKPTPEEEKQYSELKKKLEERGFFDLMYPKDKE